MPLTSLMWTTKEGTRIPIKDMATPHLLSTIHMIERNRMTNLQSLAHIENLTDEILDYYARFPDAYYALCEEAERRKLICRGGPREGLIRRRK